jgi:ATP phosphoribosyltransferase regulatory subunit
MANRRWLLPEAIEDVLPRDAMRIESMRRRVLDELMAHGYELVMPPLLEYVESLVGERGQDLDLRTFKLVDQLSGRSMALRADITPQVARIDAHLLNRAGRARLCYCGSVLHTLPAGFNATREPLQIGAEIYGHSGLEADIESIRLLASALRLCELAPSRIDLGHVAVFRALATLAGLAVERRRSCSAPCRARMCRWSGNWWPALLHSPAQRCWPCRSCTATGVFSTRPPSFCLNCRRLSVRSPTCGAWQMRWLISP